MKNPVRVIGGGLAGSEAAWQLANAGVAVVIHEMRPGHSTEAHKTNDFGELVCSNSLRSDDNERSAVGLLHDEMRKGNSLVMRAADANRVPAGSALAVDREAFAQTVTKELSSHPFITIVNEELRELPINSNDIFIISTGPLTTERLANSIKSITGESSFSFFDAIAPIVHTHSIDMSKAWKQSRYDKIGPEGDGADYINCPMDKELYEAFIKELLAAPKIDFKEWEKTTPYFEGCLPIEVMAERGPETLRFGPMKPVGLTNPHTQKRPYAVVQLRQDNKLGTLYNLVGFQTKMKHPEQQRVFRMIPGLENAEFARLGGLHKNTFINSPALLDECMRLKKHPHIRFAGQVTGVEGYVESAAMGLLAGCFAATEAKGKNIMLPPRTTALGALLAHITQNADAQTFQPMNVNFGLFPPITTVKGKRDRKLAYTERAKKDILEWLTWKNSAI